MRLMVLVAYACLLAGCGDGRTRACFGSEEFCDDAFGRNSAPRARAGADLEVAAGDPVQLDASASFDTDGRIDSYSWTQQAGPTVALNGSSQAVADFAAPDVAVETTLDFRLVVTDDDDASDTDSVRVTVVPADVAALRAGIDLLDTLHRPEPVYRDRQCADCRAYLGLWLGARVAAARAEPSVEMLLDELRVIETVQASEVSTASLRPAARRVFELGQSALATFTAHRDPAVAALARELGGVLGPVTAETWHSALTAAYPHRNWAPDPHRQSMGAARSLRREPPGTDPVMVAASTLYLALGANRDVPAHVPRTSFEDTGGVH